jgi:hypothetical protein
MAEASRYISAPASSSGKLSRPAACHRAKGVPASTCGTAFKSVVALCVRHGSCYCEGLPALSAVCVHPVAHEQLLHDSNPVQELRGTACMHSKRTCCCGLLPSSTCRSYTEMWGGRASRCSECRHCARVSPGSPATQHHAGMHQQASRGHTQHIWCAQHSSVARLNTSGVRRTAVWHDSAHT